MSRRRQIQQAVAIYEGFRELRADDRPISVRVRTPKAAALIGYVESLSYTTTHGHKGKLYTHPFRRGSRPILCVSADGRQLLLLGGRFEFDARGIVDKDAHGRDIIPRAHHRK